MSYTSTEGRRQLLDELAGAIEQLALALAVLGEAYEQLDEDAADRLEQELFRPAQSAYGVAQRTHSTFAAQHGLPGRRFEQRAPGLPAEPRAQLERAVQAVQEADQLLADLQDSMLPVEVGDPQLRAGLSRVRELIAPLPLRARELLRGLGR